MGVGGGRVGFDRCTSSRKRQAIGGNVTSEEIQWKREQHDNRVTWGTVVFLIAVPLFIAWLSSGCTGPAGPMGPQGIRGVKGQDAENIRASILIHDIFGPNGLVRIWLPPELGTDPFAFDYHLTVEGSGVPYEGTVHNFQETSGEYYALGYGLDRMAGRIRITLSNLGWSDQEFWLVVTPLTLIPIESLDGASVEVDGL